MRLALSRKMPITKWPGSMPEMPRWIRVNLAFMENGTVQFEIAFLGKEEAIKKEIANCAPRVLASKNEASVPPGKEFAISIPNIQKELGIVKKGVNRKRLSTKFSREALIGPYPKKKLITFYLLLM